MQAARRPTRLDLPFAAPVPRGHSVVLLRIQHADDGRAGTALIDATTGVVYCEESMFGLFAFATAASEPARVAQGLGWEIVEQLAGRAAGATVATSRSPREASVRTCLFLDTSEAPPYR